MPDFPIFQVVQDRNPNNSRPFGVAQTSMTLTGPRTSVVQMGFSTEEAAQAFIEANRDKTLDKWKALCSLAGHWQDGSQELVQLFWDDATVTAHISVGKKRYWGHSFDEALAKAIADQKAMSNDSEA